MLTIYQIHTDSDKQTENSKKVYFTEIIPLNRNLYIVWDFKSNLNTRNFSNLSFTNFLIQLKQESKIKCMVLAINVKTILKWISWAIGLAVVNILRDSE